jgi:AraC-like DNA-binding protein
VKHSPKQKEYAFNKSERTDFADFNCHRTAAKNVDMHMHTDYYEFVIATDTDLYNDIGVDGFPVQRCLQRVQDVIVLKPGISHGLHGIGNQRAPHYNIAVKAAWFDSFIRNKESLKRYLAVNPLLTIHLNGTEFQYVQMLIDKIDNQKYDARGVTLLETILHVIVFCAMDMLKHAEGENERISYYCRDALMKIDNFTFVSKSAADLYSCYPVSHTAFFNEFKRLCGVSPSKYLADKKMEYAKTLLLTTNLSVLQISDELQYSSVSYFIKKFKTMYGLSPLQYRKANTGEVLTIHHTE